MSCKLPAKLSSGYFNEKYNSSSTPSYLMGASLTQEKHRFQSTNSEYGKGLTSTMGSGASSHQSSSHNSRSRGSSLSETSGLNNYNKQRNFRYGPQNTSGSSPQITRPLPQGPGPLLPKSYKFPSRRKQDAAVKSQGPLKASHEINQRGICSYDSPNKTSKPEQEHQNLSRHKSRSLNDVRAPDNRQDQKATADKMLTHADLKRARKTFKISRSPSCDNLSNSRRLPEDRALLDKMSKISTDESARRRIGSSSRIAVDTLPSKGKPEISMSVTRRLPSVNRTFNDQKIISNDKQVSEKEISHDRNRDTKITTMNRETLLQPKRTLSDSAYESMSTNSSNSSTNSPRLTRKQSIGAESRSIPSESLGHGLVGLRNLGNTCFMNSIIQCLRNIRKLRDVFCKDCFMENINETTAPMKGRLAKAFSAVVKDMWMANSHGLAISPNCLKSQVQRYAPRFTGFNQQDSQEFMRFLLEGLHDDLNIATEKGKIQQVHANNLCEAEQARQAWNSYLKREKSIISDLFVGQLKSTLTCTDCKHCSLTFDPFWDLSLPIPSQTRTSLLSGKVSLHDCFKKFTQEEVLDGDEKPTCEMCKKRRKCLKRFSIERFPQILVIHLKRFSGLRYRTKLDTLVDFSFDLNLSSFAANSSCNKTEAMYRLCGISNHSGGTYSGHYTAHCRHPDTNDWHYYSDSCVSKLPSSRVVTEEAYVLFYELCNQMSYL